MSYPGAELRWLNMALSADWSEPKIAHRPENDVQAGLKPSSTAGVDGRRPGRDVEAE